MSKVFKTVTSQELENATRDGWVLQLMHNVPLTEKRFIDERPNSYHGDKRRIEFGDVLIFVVSKEADTIDREQQLQAYNTRLIEDLRKFVDVEKQLKQAADEIATLKAKSDQLGKACVDIRTEHDGKVKALVEQNRKLEADLAKVRREIGEKQWKEIVGGETR